MIKSINIEYTGTGDLLPLRDRIGAYPPGQVLIQVFSGFAGHDENEKLRTELIETFPRIPIIGTTTAGEIMNGEVSDKKIIINFMLFNDTEVRTILIEQNGDMEKAGNDIGDSFSELKPKAVIIFGCGIRDKRTVDGSLMISTVQNKIPGAILAGAQAGDGGAGLTSHVFCESGLTDRGFAAAALYGGKLIVNNEYNLAWVPIGKTLTITRANGPRVYSIDNATPYDLYRHYLGQEIADGLPLSAVDFPLMIEREGITMAIHAMGVNDDGSFDYIHSFHPGEQLKFGFCHAGLLALGAQSTYSKLRKKPVDAAFMYTCVSRKWILGADIEVEVCPIARLAPLAGFFAYGEYFSHPGGKGLFFSQTMTVLTLAEEDDNHIHPSDSGEACPDHNDSKQLKTLQALHRLVETSAKEIETINEELAAKAQKDSMTGLYNRRYLEVQFAKEIRRTSRNKKPLSMILFDVDNFKFYNDTYGHIAGDNCLRGIALEVKKVFKRPVDLFARYGGEEFFCLLPETDSAGAVHLAGEIQKSIRRLAFRHETSQASDYVTVFLGVLTVNHVRPDMTQDELIGICDKELYGAKSDGRDRYKLRVID